LGIQSLKFVRAALASGVFLLVLVSLYVVHVRYFRVDVVFYSALFDVLAAAGICTALLWAIPAFKVFNPLEKTQLTAIWLLTGYACAISVPTVIDRSLSFYILEKLDQRGGGIRQEAFDDIVAHEFMQEHRLIDARLTEQLNSGTIEIRNGCVLLADKGRRIATFSRAFRTHFLPRKRLLMGTYSDDLTDPFERSAPAVDYACAE